jgi:ankyrin repeat protein
MRTGFRHLIISVAVSSFFYQTVLGDGCFVTNNYGQDVYAPDQKVAIAWDGSIEVMILATKLQSKIIADFGWLIPIKASEQPQVTVGDMQVFYDLSDYFKSLRQEIKESQTLTAGHKAEIPDIQVLEKKKLDVYDITVLKAKDAKALADWLTQNSFKFPPDANSTLGFYTNQDFFFIAVKIDLSNRYKDEIASIGENKLKLIESVADKIRRPYANPEDIQNVVLAVLHNQQFDRSLSDYMSREEYEGLQKEYLSKSNGAEELPKSIDIMCKVISDLKSGIATPLKISFRTSQPTFPLKISSINKGEVKVTAYVLSHEPLTDKASILKLEKCLQTTTGIKEKLSRYLPVDSTEWVSQLVFDGNSYAFTQDAYFEPIEQKLLNLANDKTEMLYRAIRDGDLEKTKILLADFPNINQRLLICTPLEYAVQSKQRAVAEYLISKGANVNPTDYSQGGPILFPAILSGDMNMIKLLVDKGADINATSALTTAIIMDNIEAVKLFLEHGASVNSPDEVGTTALHHAVETGQIQMVKLLLEHGANIDAKDELDETPLHSFIHLPWLVEPNLLEVAKLLLDKGANPNTISHGKPLLNDAVDYREEEFVKLLLEKGANVNSKDAKGNTPLQIAVKSNKQSMIQLLMKYGAK